MHRFLLLVTDTVLAGDGPAQLGADFHNIPAGLVRLLQLLGTPRIKHQQRVQIAVAGVEDVADRTTIFFGDFSNALQGFGQPAPQHAAVVDQVVRRQVADGPKGTAPPLPEQVALRLVLGGPNFAALGGHAYFLDLLGLLLQASVHTFDFDDQHRRCILGVAAWGAHLHRFDDRVVHHLQGQWHNTGPDDLRDRAGGMRNLVINGQHGNDRFGLRRDSYDNLGRHPETPFTADHESAQIIARRIKRRPGNIDNLAVGGNHFHAENVVRGHTVFQATRAAGVFTDITADSGDFLAGRIRRKKHAERCHRLLQLKIGHPRMHHRITTLGMDFQYFIEPGQCNDHTGMTDCTTGEVGGKTARNRGHPGSVRFTQHARHLFRRAGKNDDSRHIRRNYRGIVGV